MRYLILVVFISSYNVGLAQIPVEVFGGNRKTSLDMMFFRFFKNKYRENSYWLFFNRNRASIDYTMPESANLPSLGFTEAISFNHPKLGGLAPVVVGQIFYTGIYPKTGIQYVYISEKLTFFSWLVIETLKTPDIDYFLLIRYVPRLSEKLNLFAQFEALSSFPTTSPGNYNFTQRL